MVMAYQLQSTPQYIPARDLAARNAEQNPRQRSLTPGVALAVALLIIAAVLGFGGDAAATGSIQPVSDSSEVADTIEIYVVQPGDTLWEIAGALAMPGEDVRPLVDALQEISGGSSLEIGQRLVIDHTMIRR